MKSKVDLVQDIVVPWSLYGAFIGALAGTGVGWALADAFSEGVILPLCILPALLVGTLVGYHFSAKEVDIKLRQRAMYERKIWAERKAKRQAEIDRERKRAIVELEYIGGLHDGLLERAHIAAGHLARAGRDYHDRMFASFWDHVEIAANDLVAYHRALLEVAARVAAYDQGRKHALDALPDVQEVFDTLPDHVALVDGLKKIVRCASGVDECERLFQCRKSNAILVPGSGSLENVLEGLSDRLSSAVNDLTKSTGPLHSSHGRGGLERFSDQRSERFKALLPEDPTFTEALGQDRSLAWSSTQMINAQARAGVLGGDFQRRSAKAAEEPKFW